MLGLLEQLLQIPLLLAYQLVLEFNEVLIGPIEESVMLGER